MLQSKIQNDCRANLSTAEHDGEKLGPCSTSHKHLAQRSSEDPPFDIAIVIASSVSLLTLASILDALKAANSVLERQSYRYDCFSADVECSSISSGISLRTRAISELRSANLVLLVGDVAPTADDVKHQLIREVRRLSRHGVPIGSVGAAGIVVWEAGLIRNHSWTLPWEWIQPFRETYPGAEINSRLFTISNSIVTCAGQIAAFDMMLEIFSRHWGVSVASSIAQRCLHPGLRAGDQSQRWDVRDRLGLTDPATIRAVRKMEENIEIPVRIGELAAFACVSQRRLERSFRKHLGTTPGQYYLRLRLESAQRLLRRSGLSIVQVALATGFISASHFAKVYQANFGKLPRQDRS